MAFYPDELSPIDRISAFGNLNDLHDINSLKNRRQWKSLVLGKKDMGLNNFATIAEEKEDEISSDENPEGHCNKDGGQFSETICGIVRNKKITFAKPRKYITSRMADEKVLEAEHPLPFPSASLPVDLSFRGKRRAGVGSPGAESPSALPMALGAQSLRGPVPPPGPHPYGGQVVLDGKQILADPVVESNPSSCWQTRRPDRDETNFFLARKAEDKKKSPRTVKFGNLSKEGRKDTKSGKSATRNEAHKEKESSRSPTPPPPASLPPQPLSSSLQSEVPADSFNMTRKLHHKILDSGKSTRQKEEKQKTNLNMKDVVNVYKNLAYGSEQEIKSFVENLSFVKEESKKEKNKNLISVMNLKALETKIKKIAKNGGKHQKKQASQGKKSKQGKLRNRKSHIEKLPRQEVVKVPAAFTNSHSKGKKESCKNQSRNEGKKPEKRREEKEPWKYVGMQSVLDKTYLVYPAYPPSINLKKSAKKGKTRTPGVACIVESSGGGTDSKPCEKRKKKDPMFRKPPKPEDRRQKIKVSATDGSDSRTVLPKNETRSTNVLGIRNGKASGKSLNRPSATTVCKVEFPPSVGSDVRVESSRRTESEYPDESLLVYLHGTKAINVKSPYSNRQFSRVKFFRKDGRGMPLIKGLGHKVVSKNGRRVSVKNVSLPEKLFSLRSFDLFDFDDDIENINDFLRSQENSERQRQHQNQKGKKSSRRWSTVREPDKEISIQRHRSWCSPRQQQQVQHQYQSHNHYHHQHGTTWKSNLSPDSLVNEISQNIQHLQYLPDTEENRNLIGKFFDDLEERIEASKERQLSLGTFSSFDDPSWYHIDMGSEHYCLKWNNHQSNLLGVFSQLLQDESLVDVTLACAEGHSIRAHKVVLSACSSYFQTLFIDHPNRHPIVILKDVCFNELKTLVDFMYKGEVNVEYCQLSALLKTAESLKVKGLTEMTNLNSIAATPVKNDKEEEVAKDQVEMVSQEKESVVAEMPPGIETANKRLTNEDTKPTSPDRVSSPGPPRSKRSSRGPDCDDTGDRDRDSIDLPDRNVKGGCPGPTDMSASGLALCQMPPSCSSPHVSEPFPGTSCLPPVQQVPLSLKKEVEWDNKSATGESSLEFRHPPDSDVSDEDLDDRYESLSCGYPKDLRRRDCRATTPFQLPFSSFGSFADAGELSARQNCSFFGLLPQQAFLSAPAIDDAGRYVHGGGSAPFRCAICLAAFPSSWLLEQHATLQHSINSRNSETGSPGEDKPFKCEQCGQSYRYRSAYFKHQEQNHRAKPPADKLFTCDVCGMQFRYLKSFKKHRLNHALEKLHTKSPNGEPSVGGRSNGALDNCLDNVGDFPIEFNVRTNRSFFCLADMKTNGEVKESGRVTAPPSTTDGGSDQVTSSNEAVEGSDRIAGVLERAASAPVGRTDRADLFNPSKDSYQLKEMNPESVPRKRGRADRIFDPDEQDETIDSIGSSLPESKETFGCRRESPLLNLLRTDASDRQRDSKFSCPFCAKCVRSKENLKLHIRKHTGERPFACLFCGRAFGGKSDLTRHLRIHTGERPYHCEMCGKCFARADYLSKHLTTHVHSHNSSRLSFPQGNR